MLAAGDLFADRFEIVALAGKGGMGQVFRARDRLSGGDVALKILTTEAGVERFTREARLLAELEHPAVVRYVAHGVTGDGMPYIAMEWVEGETLSRRLRQAALSDDEALGIVGRVAEALSVAHARGVVHRDVKPGNVILVRGSADRVKLLDFGIAHVGDPTALVTETGAVLGTVGYMAPEQARGVAKVDARADVFSLGVMLFHCLTGRMPFGGGPPVAILAKLVLDDAPRLGSLRPDLPAALDDLVARLLAKEPAGRPADGTAVVRELAAVRLEAGSAHAPAPEPEEALTGSEQRLVAVLLASAIAEEPASEWGSTAFELSDASSASEASDRPTRAPSRASGRIIRELRQAAAPFGARLEPLRSGSVALMLSGASTDGATSATDLVARAARCALALRPLLPDAPMALATGRGVVAGDLPVGEAIERAAELVTRAPSGGVGIAVDAMTRGLLDARFEVGEARGCALLLGERKHGETTRKLLGRPTKTVGRERELGFVLALLDECISEPVARALLVTGPAGIGKSRLRYEALHRIERSHDGVQVWTARGDPVGAGSPFGLLAQLLRQVAEVRDGEDGTDSLAKLRARVARHVQGDAVERVATFLAELARVEPGSPDAAELAAARRDPVLMGDQMRRAFEDFVLAESSAGPLLFVLEDLHWGDGATVSFLDSMLRVASESPVMVLALARPDVHERFVGLWQQRGLQEIRLAGLGRKPAEALVREVLGKDVTSELVQRIVERADGNAFYLEELIRSVAEGDGQSLPETVLAMVQSRLEALPDGARRVLRAASIFGGGFWDGGVAQLLGSEQELDRDREWLDVLAHRELVTPRGSSRFPGEREYVFRHALVRDAAYAMLTDEDRRRGHRLAGTWLEEHGEPDALVLAQHFELGRQPERALAWCCTAAEEAFKGNDVPAALRAIVRANGLASEVELEPAEKGSMLLLEAEILYWSGRHAEAQPLARSAVELLEPGSDAWYHASAELMLASHRSGDTAAEVAIGRELLEGGWCDLPGISALLCVTRVATGLVQIGEAELADRMFERFDRWVGEFRDVPAAYARWQASLAVRALYSGDPYAYGELSRAAALGCARAGDPRGAALHGHNVAHAELELGQYEAAEQQFRDVIATAKRLGLANVEASALNNLGAVIGRLGRHEEAKRLLVDAVTWLEAQTDRRMEGGARNHLAEVHLALAESERAVAEAERAIERLGKVAPLRVQARGTLARALLASGRIERALSEARCAHEELEALGSMADGEGAVRLAYAEALLASGDAEKGRRVLARARDRLERRAAIIADESARRDFLERVAEHARTLALAAERSA